VPTDTLAPGRQPVRVETPTDSETRTVVIDAHTLRIERTGPSTEYRFHLETTGEPEPNADGDRIVRQLVDGEVATIPTCKSTATDGATVGTVTGDSDIYIITGELEFFFKGDTSGRVYLDGEEIDPDTTC
jgi:archaellum component FlaG (FlaF/FlaG flagellin family)